MAACFLATPALLVRGLIHLPEERLGTRIRFADGTSAPVHRETRLGSGLARDPCTLVVAFRLRLVGAAAPPAVRPRPPGSADLGRTAGGPAEAPRVGGAAPTEPAQTRVDGPGRPQQWRTGRTPGGAARSGCGSGCPGRRGCAGRAGTLGVRPALPTAATGTDPESGTRSGTGLFDLV
ncbi:hypothetical protein ACQI4E_26325 [Streptomyces sp. CA-252508]|uniref:hypothetical protein n=1 Tax=Streptomyces sp. CA-252508 TaxID=3418946 RepID=UPI003D91BFC4